MLSTAWEVRAPQCKVSLNQPSSIPDYALTLPWTSAVPYVLSMLSTDVIDASLYRNSVHCSNGVLVPQEIANDLSLGMKYLNFFSPNKALVREEWLEFVQRLRWQIFFLFKEGPNRPFDPDYKVESDTSKKPPTLPQWMELGLVMGRRHVLRTVNNIPASIIEEIRKNPFAPRVNKILQFLLVNNYVVTMTDKNLGLAVSERDWLRRNELALLEDKRNYIELDKIDADAIMQIKSDEMLSLADLADEHIDLSNLGLVKFFKSKVT